jgi:hypothetical protein
MTRALMNAHPAFGLAERFRRFATETADPKYIELFLRTARVLDDFQNGASQSVTHSVLAQQ